MPKFFHPYTGSVGRFFEGDPSLVRYWQLANALDNSGNGKTLTIGSGISLNRFNFLNGKGISVFGDGSANAKATWAENLQFGDFTQLCWFRCPIYNTDWRMFFQIGGGGSNNNICGLGIVKSNDATNPGKGWFGAYFSGGYDLYSPQRYDDNIWHLIVRVRQGSNHYGYVDGKLVISGTISTTLTNPGQEAVFYNRFYNTQFFYGELAEVSLFNRALSPQEISQYYQWATSAPKKYWFFVKPFIELNTQFLLSPSLRTTEKLTGNLNMIFNIKSGIKEILRPLGNINFSSVSQANLGKIVQGVVRKILNPKGGGIIKNR